MTTLANKVLKSSSLLIASKMLQRLIGLVSIMVLARLLTPDDFAIVALTAIIIYFFDMLSNVGTEQYIIQKENVSEQDLNTAWTIDLISKSALWLILIISAPFISDYFEQPQLKNAIYVMSFLLPLNALKNPGIFLLKSELNYKKLFWLTLIQKVISFTVVITIAFLSPSFWALIIADLVASIIFLVGSYKIHTFRPKFSLLNCNEQWLFSKWLLLKGIVGYIRSQIDTLIVSKLFSPAILGQYYMARNVAMLPAHNLLYPAIEPLLASFSVDKNTPEKFVKQINFSLMAISMVVFPLVIFISFFPDLIINFLLGDKWTSSYRLMSFLTLLLLYFPFVLVFEQVLIVKGKVKTTFFFDLFSLMLIIFVFIVIPLEQPEDIAFYRGITGCISTLILAIYLKKLINYSLTYQIFFAAFCASFSFIAALLAIKLSVQIENNVIALGITSIIFSCCYVFLLFSFIAVFNSRNSELEHIQQLLTIKVYNRLL